MKKRHTSFITNFMKKNGAPKELVDKWLSNEVQEKWSRMFVTNAPKKRCTCYILYCLDKREPLKTLHPNRTPAEITSLLAANWRKHKEAKDEVYTYYKTRDSKQVFCEKAKSKIILKYPKMSEEEVAVLVEKMYKLSLNLDE